MSYKEILEMVDRDIDPGVMTKAEALEFLELLGNAVEIRVEGIKVDMANEGDLAKLPKLKTKPQRPQAGTAPTSADWTGGLDEARRKVTTRFKTPRAKK